MVAVPEFSIIDRDVAEPSGSIIGQNGREIEQVLRSHCAQITAVLASQRTNRMRGRSSAT